MTLIAAQPDLFGEPHLVGLSQADAIVTPGEELRWTENFENMGSRSRKPSRLFGGDWPTFAVTWLAGAAGTWLRQEMGRRHFNPIEVPIGRYASGLESGVRGVRIGFIRHFHETDVPADPEVTARLEQVAHTLQSLGAEIRDVRLPTLGEFAAVNRVILQSEAWAIHGHMAA